MRRFLLGIVAPLILWMLVVWARASWPYDVHPWQFMWIVWVVSMSLGSFLAGIGFRMFWTEGRDKPEEHDEVQLAADESVDE